MDQIRVGKFIAECRKEKHLTQAELAEMLGITNKSVSKWECGRCLPDSSLYVSLCTKLDISVSELFAGRKLDSSETDKQVFEESLVELVRLYEKIKSYKNVLIGSFIFILGLLFRSFQFSGSSSFSQFIEGLSIGLSIGTMLIGIVWIVYGLTKITNYNNKN